MLRTFAIGILIAPLFLACRGPQAPSIEGRAVERAQMTVIRPILSDGVQVGSLATYRRSGGGQPWVKLVRNTHGQDLGLIDALGRVWRYTPHGDEEVVREPDLLQALGRVLRVREGAVISLGPAEPQQQKDTPRP
jgi:hypothetical protein